MSASISETPRSPRVLTRVLIVDDSKIVRATLAKHMEGVFEAREASDGIEAWETLLIDPNVRIVVTDLSMPRLDGYGLLERMRQSKIARIRAIPVVVMSGSQEPEEQERAIAAGATDLIGKGVTMSELLARLDLLARLEGMQHAIEVGLDARVKSAYGNNRIALQSTMALENRAQHLLAGARENDNKFMLLTIRIGLRHVALSAYRALPPDSVLDAVGQLLAWSVRQSDCVSQTDVAQFTLVTASVPVSGMRGFAGRVCSAIATAHQVEDAQMVLVVSGGLVSLADLPETVADAGSLPGAVTGLRRIAARRATLGFDRGRSGVVDCDETGPP